MGKIQTAQIYHSFYGIIMSFLRVNVSFYDIIIPFFNYLYMQTDIWFCFLSSAANK